MPDDPRDQETDFEALGQEDDESKPMQIRYGVTAEEATHREPLDVALSQEEQDLTVPDDGPWDEIVPEPPGPARTHAAGGLDDDLDEEQVAEPAEQQAMHSEPER